jgi:hypothetical protein
MGRELRLVGLVVLAAIAASFFDTYNKQPAKPMPVPLPVAKDDTKSVSEPRTVRIIAIYKTPPDQVPADTPSPPTATPVEPISAFPETATLPLPEALPASLHTTPPPPPPQKTAATFCEQFHMHKVFINNGKNWRCVK